MVGADRPNKRLGGNFRRVRFDGCRHTTPIMVSCDASIWVRPGRVIAAVRPNSRCNATFASSKRLLGRPSRPPAGQSRRTPRRCRRPPRTFPMFRERLLQEH